MTFGQRIAGVLTLSASAFEEIEADKRANAQALAVVVLASVAGGIGAGLVFGPFALLTETFAALIGWVMWAAVTYVIGTKLFPEPQTQSDMGELLRVIGFSYAPQVFSIFTFVPVLGRGVQVFVALWLLAATIIAVRQALDYRSTWRAVAVVLIGWAFFVVIQLIFSVGPA